MNNDKVLKIHQQKAIEFFRQKNFGALTMEMRTGKTAVVLKILEEKGAERILFVSGKIQLPDLESQVTEWSRYTARIIKRSADPLPQGVNVTLVNYDLLRGLEKQLMAARWDAIVLDESTAIKNGSIRAKICLALRKTAKYRFILTGTPNPKGYEDLYRQYKFLCDDIMPRFFGDFKRLYCVRRSIRAGSRMVDIIVGYQNIFESTIPGIPSLMDRIRPHTFTVRLNDVSTQPENTYDTVMFDLDPVTRDKYDELQRDFVTTIQKQTVSIASALGCAAKLHQLANGFYYTDNKTIDLYNDPKLVWLKDNVLTMPGKVVIFYHFKHTGVLLAELFKDTSFVRVSADMNVDGYGKAVEMFQTDSSIKLFLCPIAIGDKGIKLFAADTCIYVNYDFDLNRRIQSEARLRHLERTTPIRYIVLAIRNTIEQTILKSLATKKRMLTNSLANLVSFILGGNDNGIEQRDDSEDLAGERVGEADSIFKGGIEGP